jgi:hypothetical protein
MIQFLARQKLRLDLGFGFLSIITFALMVLSNADRISSYLSLSISGVMLTVIPISIFFVWLFGYILDRLKFIDCYQHEQTERNKLLKNIHEETTRDRSR